MSSVSNKAQRLEISQITCMGRKVDKLNFDGGKAAESNEQRSNGSLSVTTKVVTDYVGEDGTKYCQLNVGLEIAPELAGRYYSISMAVSGIYSAPKDMDDAVFNDAVLTFGSSDLYSYAKEIAETVCADGVWGNLYLPQVSFTVED